MLHALIDPNNEILRIEGNIDPNVQTKLGYYWLPVVDIPRPVYNTDTQVAVLSTVIGEDSVTRSWTIRDKTAEEIDASKIQKINAIDPVILSVLHGMENSIRTHQSQSTLTMDQFKEFLKELI